MGAGCSADYVIPYNTRIRGVLKSSESSEQTIHCRDEARWSAQLWLLTQQ